MSQKVVIDENDRSDAKPLLIYADQPKVSGSATDVLSPRAIAPCALEISGLASCPHVGPCEPFPEGTSADV
jgi:hypothetical protein